jgi:outer membrane protein TolC
MKQLIKLLVCCLLPVAATAQQTLSVEEVMAIVKKFHPVAKQTAIGVQIAQADVTNARAGFDPLFMGNVQRKTFDRIDYYTYTSPQLVIPTWYGIEVSGGTEYLRGSRTDPQESAGRTSFVGINIPLAKNLVMDKRRAALQQAKIFVNQSKAEQKSIINDLLYDAAAAYWKWVTAFEVHTVLSNAVMVNEKRFEMIKKTVRIGERPAIDTVEALAQLQQFQYLQNEAWLDYLNAGIDLSVYLWQQNNQPFVLTTTIQPARQWDIPALLADPVQEEATLFAAVPNHPDIQQYQFKLAGLEVERKLRAVAKSRF